MNARVIWGQLPDGQFGAIASRPGYDCFAEPVGSKGLAFDSRVGQLGGAWKIGSCSLNQIVPYPSVPSFQPLLIFSRISGNTLVANDFFNSASGQHTGYMWVGVCYSDHFKIQPIGTDFVSADVVSYDTAAVFSYVLLKGDA